MYRVEWYWLFLARYTDCLLQSKEPTFLFLKKGRRSTRFFVIQSFLQRVGIHNWSMVSTYDFFKIYWFTVLVIDYNCSKWNYFKRCLITGESLKFEIICKRLWFFVSNKAVGWLFIFGQNFKCACIDRS